MNKEKLILEISSRINSSGSSANKWYVGIASDARSRLFVEHRVNEKTGAWIYRIAESSNEAREAERHFLDTVLTDGGPGGGDWIATQVYAYKKTGRTKP